MRSLEPSLLQLRRRRERLRAAAWPIAQTAAAATVAWFLADLLLPQDQPTFAPIAAVISLGAAFGERGRRGLELIGGVVVGIALADLFVTFAGPGPLQIGLLVVVAMTAAVLIGGGPTFVAEAAVSAIIIATLQPTGAALSPDRLLEGLLGGAVALVVNGLLFPPNPLLVVGRAGQAVFQDLATTLRDVAAALEAADAERASEALLVARGLDGRIHALDAALDEGRETARLAPPRRGARSELELWEQTVRQLDLAVRNTRVLARDVLRFTRTGQHAPPALAAAMRDLASAVWELSAEIDERGRGEEVRRLARRAVAGATAVLAERRDLETSEIVGQIRSLAADLLRASELGGPTAADHLSPDAPTEELLAAPRVRREDDG